MAFSNGVNKNVNNEEENGKPYVFNDEDFTTMFKTQEGSLRALKKFNENCNVLNGIENYRMVIFEANPLTFLTPSHWDCDIVFFVGQGKGSISLVFEDKRESYNIERGHLMIIPAGVTFYIINNHEVDQLILSMFTSSFANPGDFVTFFGTGGEDPESYLYTFSSLVLETSFNASKEKLHKIFSKQRKGVILKASKEQINALTVEDGKEGNPQFAPYQILDHLREVNECGKLFMVDFRQFKKLEDLSMFVSFCNLMQGCMTSPFISARATKIIMVVKGHGRFEMVAPRNGEQGSVGTQYKKISSEFKPGMVLVIPPSHPMVLMADEGEKTETICFEVHAKGNQKFSLAGKVNVMKNFHKEAKELAFGSSFEEVDEVLDSQHLDSFLKWSK